MTTPTMSRRSLKAATARAGWGLASPRPFGHVTWRCTRNTASSARLNLGNSTEAKHDYWLWRSDDQPWVFNLGTQEGYWRARASYGAIETALRLMREQADVEGISSIAMPRIGVGYGGLSWKKVRAIIEPVFEDWDGTLVVYEEFVPSSSDPA